MAYLVRQLFWVLSSFTIFQPLILLHRLEDKRMFAFRIAALYICHFYGTISNLLSPAL